MNIVSDRLKQAMEQRGFKQADLLRAAEAADVKLGKSQLSQYVSGKTIPREAQLAACSSSGTQSTALR